MTTYKYQVILFIRRLHIITEVQVQTTMLLIPLTMSDLSSISDIVEDTSSCTEGPVVNFEIRSLV